MLFAVRLDTFEMKDQTAVFYIGSNDTAELESIGGISWPTSSRSRFPANIFTGTPSTSPKSTARTPSWQFSISARIGCRPYSR